MPEQRELVRIKNTLNRDVQIGVHIAKANEISEVFFGDINPHSLANGRFVLVEEQGEDTPSEVIEESSEASDEEVVEDDGAVDG